jgi:uncharacterized phage protein (TIGR01671 family)
MDREIKFRGKTESNQFIFGDLIQYENGDTAIFEKKITRYGYEATQISNRTKVDKETIGQFTGLHDKNGKDVYENDLVLVNGQIYEVVYVKGMFAIGIKGCGYVPLKNVIFEIIGNIYDNKDLLEE